MKKKNERLNLFQQMEAELKQMNEAVGTTCSDESLRVIMRIHRELHVVILRNELERVERRRQRGKITGKQAQHLKARSGNRGCKQEVPVQVYLWNGIDTQWFISMWVYGINSVAGMGELW